MKHEPKVILFMATSANGIIAGKDGSEDFLSHTNWIQFVTLANQVGCFMWGRKTYEAVIKWPESYFKELEQVKKIIISTSDITLKEGFILAHSPEEALQIVRNEGFESTIITGGSTINSEFAKRALIDEVILNINPSILGEGIPLFKPEDFLINMQYVTSKTLDDGIIKVTYKVMYKED